MKPIYPDLIQWDVDVKMPKSTDLAFNSSKVKSVDISQDIMMPIFTDLKERLYFK